MTSYPLTYADDDYDIIVIHVINYHNPAQRYVEMLRLNWPLVW